MVPVARVGRAEESGAPVRFAANANRLRDPKLTMNRVLANLTLRHSLDARRGSCRGQFRHAPLRDALAGWKGIEMGCSRIVPD